MPTDHLIAGPGGLQRPCITCGKTITAGENYTHIWEKNGVGEYAIDVVEHEKCPPKESA